MSINIPEKTYEYCRINYQVQDSGYDPTHAEPHKLIWGQFRAVVENTSGGYVAARSERFPLSNHIGADPYPDARNVGHRNILNIFIEKLEQDGWEFTRPYNSDLWWEKRLRRVESAAKPQRTLKQRLAAAFSLS